MRLAATFLVLMLTVASAAEKTQITAQFDIVQLSQQRAMELIPQLEDPKTSRAALRAIEKESRQRTADSAILLHSLWARGFEGEVLVAKAVEEVIWPTDYLREDPNFLATTTTAADPTGYAARRFASDSSAGASIELSGWPLFNADGDIVVSCDTVNSSFAGWTFFETGMLPNGRILRIQRPTFCRRSTQAVALTRTDTPVLVGSFKLPDPKGRFELHILTVSAETHQVSPKLAQRLKTNARPDGPLFSKPPAFCRAELLTFSVPTSKALAIREITGSGANTERAIARLLQTVSRNPGALIDKLSFPYALGFRAVSVSGVLISHAVEPDRPSPPHTFGGGGMSIEPKFLRLNFVPRQDPPSAFQSQFVGTQLEVEAEGVTGIDRDGAPSVQQSCSFIATTTQQKGHFCWANPVTPNGQITAQYSPYVETQRLGGTAAAAGRNSTLIGFHKSPAGTDECQLTFLRLQSTPASHDTR